MENTVSNYHRSLVLEEFKVAEVELEELLPGRHLSLSNMATDAQSVFQVVKVSGSITVSF